MSKKRLTAAEARSLAGPTVDEHVDMALDIITEAAKKQQRSVRLHNWWANEGYQRTNDYQAACKQLTDLGYKVRFFYEELQFVNMYTIVEW